MFGAQRPRRRINVVGDRWASLLALVAKAAAGRVAAALRALAEAIVNETRTSVDERERERGSLKFGGTERGSFAFWLALNLDQKDKKKWTEEKKIISALSLSRSLVSQRREESEERKSAPSLRAFFSRCL